MRPNRLSLHIQMTAFAILGTFGLRMASGVTFNEDVAPIVHQNCAVCHRPDAIAPFSLLTYRDVAKRATQVLEVVESGYMPPWLPKPQVHKLAGERRLSAEEKRKIAEWVNVGKPEGPGRITPPEFKTGWLLGPPDVVMDFGDAFPLPAEGPDQFRNFVLNPKLSTGQWVEAFDFRPTPTGPVHHGVLMLDGTGDSRRQVGQDGRPGFAGMENGRLSFGGSAGNAGGQILGWTPGKIANRNPELAWMLNPGTDIVFQLHLQSQGKPENVTGQLGLYFSDRPPSRPTLTIFFSVRDIEIPAGESSYRATREYTLPVDVELRGIYPHAHFICRDMHVRAFLPGGKEIQLIHIPDWDFNWQDDYQYVQPLPLPQGTRIQMDYVYDNSANNPRNPFQPPRDVKWGFESNDEMGDLALMLIPERVEDYEKLRIDFTRSRLVEKLKIYTAKFERNPDDLQMLENLGEVCLMLERHQEAANYFDRILSRQPERPGTLMKNAMAYAGIGKDDQSVEMLIKAVELSPDDPSIHAVYAQQMIAQGEVQKARASYTRLLEIQPENFDALYGLARIEYSSGNRQQALRHARRATQMRTDSAEAWEFYGQLAYNPRDPKSAEQAFRTALLLNPKSMIASKGMGDLAMGRRDFQDAARYYAITLDAQPNNVDVLNNLAVAAAIQRDFASAEKYFSLSLEANPNQSSVVANLGRSLQEQGKMEQAMLQYRKAVAMPPVSPTTAQQYAWLAATATEINEAQATEALRWARFAFERQKQLNIPTLDTLAAAYAATGEFDQAETFAAQAAGLAGRVNNAKLEQQIRDRLQQYQQQKRFVRPR